MKLFDTHAHLLDERFDADRDALIASLSAAGVAHVMEACTDMAGIERTAALVAQYPFLYGSAGVHPHAAVEWGPEAATRVENALRLERVLAVGEIGLDYHYDFSPRDVQKACFSDQLAIACEKKAPVLIHDREAHGDCMELLRPLRGRLFGIMHCFSGSYEIARECIDDGLYVAFGGSLTFKNAARLREIVKKLPADRLLLETDCPYLAPEPYRGTRNDPTRVRAVLSVMAAARGEDAAALAETLYQNSLDVFGLQET